MSDPPPPPQVSPDGKFYWDGQRWVPMPAEGVSTVPAPIYAPPKKGHALRNVSLGCLGLIAVVVLIGTIGNGATKTANNSASFGSPMPASSPISEAQYKASAKTIPYVQLEKDPASLAGTVVTYAGQVVQYDTNTTTSHLRINVTPNGFGGYNDTIWLDVDPTKTSNVFRNSVIQFWGEVVGPYTYTSIANSQITIPEIKARYIQVTG
jgi:hypothetical protein